VINVDFVPCRLNNNDRINDVAGETYFQIRPFRSRLIRIVTKRSILCTQRAARGINVLYLAC
jgi:pyridoxine/pyridoxamine 5'-phosphate oxidase